MTTPTQTVQDVNDLLDTLNRSERYIKGHRLSDWAFIYLFFLSFCSDDKRKTAIYKHVVNNYTAFEQRWIIRVVLKDLKMGMSENSIFDVFHPQARELYSVCSNLKKVCEDLRNPTMKLGKSVSWSTLYERGCTKFTLWIGHCSFPAIQTAAWDQGPTKWYVLRKA